jgi:hypothetical protein
MGVVLRTAEFGVVVHVEIGMPEGQKPTHLPLGTPRRNVFRVVAIGEIGHGRRQHENGWALAALRFFARRADEERDVGLARRGFVAVAG